MNNKNGTPLRVRGKKQNKQASVQSLKRDREFAKMHRDEEEEVQQRIFSRLEILPPEILEVVFVLSQNLALTLTSTRLRDVLTSKRLVERITMDLSDSLGLFPREDLQYAEGRHAEVSFRSWEQCLKHPLFSFRWFELRIRQRMIEEARLLINDFWKKQGTTLSEAEQDHQLAKIEYAAYLVRLSKPQSAQLPVVLAATRKIVYSNQRLARVLLAKNGTLDSSLFIQLRSYQACEVGNLSDRLQLQILRGTHSDTAVLTKDEMLRPKLPDLNRPWRCDHHMVPLFLYRAPFTQVKGNLLKFLLDSSARVPDPPSPPRSVVEAASAGLVEALNDACLPAIYCLLSFCRSYTPGYRNNLPFAWGELFSDNPPIVDHGPGDDQRPDAWRHLIGPVLDGKIGDTWSTTVESEILTEDHLRACVDNMDRSPPVYAALLAGLAGIMEARNTDEHSSLTSTEFLKSLDACREKQSGQIRWILDTVWESCIL